MSLAADLLSRWAPVVVSADLVSGERGRFEVSLDGELVFSKAAQGRFPAQGEVASLVEKKLGPPLEWRKAST